MTPYIFATTTKCHFTPLYKWKGLQMIEQCRDGEIERLREEIERVANLEPVILKHVPWPKRVGALGECGPISDIDTHAECECPRCGITAHHFVPKEKPEAKMHECALCRHRYLISWDPFDE
jgi:hypothetical protein